MNQTIDKMVKEKFLTIFNSATSKAELHFKETIAPKLEGKDIFATIHTFNKIQDQLKEDRKVIQFIAYDKNSTNEDWLLKLFSTRTSMLNVDDSDDLFQAIYFGTIGSMLSDAKNEFENSNPKFSYDDFIEGKINPSYAGIESRWYIKNLEESNKVKIWQTEKIVKMVSYEATNFITKIQGSLIKESNALEILSKDLHHFNTKLKEAEFEKPEELIKQLEQLSFMFGYDFSILNSQDAVNDFNQFNNGDLAWTKINPAYINKSNSKAKESIPFSDAPIIFYTIHQVILWIEKVIAGQSVQATFEFPKYDGIIDEAKKSALAEAEKEVKSILSALNKGKAKGDKIACCLIDELEICRNQYNELDEIEINYYIAIRRGDEIPIFKINALFHELETQIDSLKEAIKVEYRINELIHEYFDVSGLHYIDYPGRENGFNPSEIMMLSNTMVLDNDLHEKMSEISNDFFVKSMSGALPIDMALHDIKEKMHDLFEECMERFLEHLENCELGNKILLIHSRLKELKQRELKLKAYQVRGNNDTFENGYANLFKEYLQLEADFIRETNNVQFIPNQALTKPKTVAIDNSTPTFGCKLEDRQKLISLIKTLTNKIDFLNSDLTSAEQLVNVFMTKDLSQELPPIYFGCETTQLRYILDKFIPYFTKLTYKNIEDSKLFYTKKGTLIKGQNLYASKIDAPKDYLEIDKAFTLIL